jgi:methionine salvage enolase-phosphatase E1
MPFDDDPLDEGHQDSEGQSYLHQRYTYFALPAGMIESSYLCFRESLATSACQDIQGYFDYSEGEEGKHTSGLRIFPGKISVGTFTLIEISDAP